MKGFYDRKNLDLDASSYFFISLLLQQITILGGYLVTAYLVLL